MTKEEQKKYITETMARDKILLIRYFTHIGCAIQVMDELSVSPLQWVHKTVKQSFNRFDRDFRTYNKQNLESVFSMHTNDTEAAGDAYLMALNATDMVVEELSTLPLHSYPDIVSLIKAYKNGEIEEKTKEV